MSRRPAHLLLLIPLGACRGVQTSLDPAGAEAGHIFSLWTLMLWICGGMYLLVIAFLGWAIWRSRKPLGLSAKPITRTEDRRLEVALAGWAGVIVLGLSVLVAASFLVDRNLASAPAGAPLKIKVTGYQWWWRVEYQDGPVDRWFETANELHLPQGRTAEIELQSNDVIHSFWVPNLSGKTDLIPGRTNTLRLTPRRAGELRGTCAEFCGFQHAHMALDVTVESPQAFETWRARQIATPAPPSSPLTQQGLAIFQDQACSMCHRIAGTEARGRTGPDLTHLGSRKSIAAGSLPYSVGALAGWIANPKAVKPGTKMPTVGLSAAETNALVAYLDTLK